MSHQLDIERIRLSAAGRRIGWRVEYLEQMSSTNDTAWHLVNGADDVAGVHGVVVLTDHQTSGRGRLGRVWHSPRGASLLVSIIISEGAPTSSGDALMLLAPVAACDAVASCTELNPQIKWPNDIVLGGRKLAGVLIESKRRPDGRVVSVCGVGINCLQQRGHFAPALTNVATSLEIESALSVDRTTLAVALLTAFDRRLLDLSHGAVEPLRRAWLARSEPMGQTIRVRSQGRLYSGTTVDIDPAAALVLQLDSGMRRIFAAQDTTVVPTGDAGL